MAKKTINVGATANDKTGDSLRTAFTKVNENFTELYTALGINADTDLNLGAFEFNGSTITTTDSTAITIDQATTVTSDLTVGGDIVPQISNGGDLGSLAKPWKSLYVSGSTIYLGGNALKIDNNGELTLNNNPIVQANGNYISLNSNVNDVNISSPQVGDTLQWAGGFWVNGSAGSTTGDITFANSTISAGANDEVIVQAKAADNFATARLNLEPEYSTARLSAFSSESVDTYTLANGDFATGVWQDNGFGNGVVSFTGAQSIGDLFQNTIFSLNAENVTIQINDEPAFTWNGGASGAGTDTPGFGTNPIVPASPITITSITFTYRRESYISVNYDNQEIRLDAQNASIRMDATNSIQMFGDNNIELQAQTTFRIAASEDIDIGTGSTYAVRVSGGDFVVSASDDVDIRGADSFRLRNDSAVAPIRIITDDDNTSQTWAFNPNGTVTFPDGTIQSTAFTGSVEADTLDSVTDRNAVTTNNITVGAVITTDITNKTSAATGNIVTDVRHWESAGASLYIWFDAASKPDVKAIGDFGDITGWTVSVSDGNSATVTATNPAGYFSISTDVALTGSGTLTFTSPNYAPASSLPVDINVGANTWRFSDDGNLTLPSGFITSNAVTGVNLRSGYDVSIISNHMDVDREWIFDSYGDLTVPGGIKSERGINIDINLSDSTLRRWRFGEDGVLNIPNGIISSNTIEISNTDAGVAQDISIYSADNILLQGGNRTSAGNPEGGDINIYAGDGGPDDGVLGSSGGGDLQIYAGDGGDGSATGFAASGGFIDIRAGNGGADLGGGGGDGGNISITAGDATNAAQDRGHISISSGAGGDETTNGGYVEINIPSAGTNLGGSWLFSGNGRSFEVPANAEIVCVNNGGITVGTFNHPTNITVQNTFTTSTYTWAFDDDGTLTFPDTTVQSTAWTGTVDWTNVTSKPSFFSGSYNDLTDKPDLAGTYQFYVAADDSTQRLVSSDNTIKFIGAGGITTASDADGNITITGSGGGGTVLEETFEDKTSATGVVTHDATTNRLFRHTSISANFTANFTNLGLAAGEATSLSLVLVQGVTARMCTAVQIGGAAQTIIWQGSALAPTGNANRTDVVTFSILCTATDTYTVLGMLTSFGG